MLFIILRALPHIFLPLLKVSARKIGGIFFSLRDYIFSFLFNLLKKDILVSNVGGHFSFEISGLRNFHLKEIKYQNVQSELTKSEWEC